jgi:hypothetical protein
MIHHMRPSVRVGSTGYLDGPAPIAERAEKGVDSFGRVFITLCVHVVGRESPRSRTYDNTGIVTIFQRWADSAGPVSNDIVTQANNTHGAPHLIRSRATAEEMNLIETLVTTGKASRVTEEVAGGTLHEELTLVDPIPLIAEARRALTQRSGVDC